MNHDLIDNQGNRKKELTLYGPETIYVAIISNISYDLNYVELYKEFVLPKTIT